MSEYLLGLVGHPLSHSLSPILHNAALQACGLKGEYRLFDIPPEKLNSDLKTIFDSGLTGFNVTIPYKQDIYRLCGEKTAQAQLTGAVNTVKVNNEKLIGHNTDTIGFQIALLEAFNANLKNETALVIGVGGAARAIVAALAQMGLAKVYLKGRDSEKVNSFINEMQSSLCQITNNLSASLSLEIYDANKSDQIALAVNATPIGLLSELPAQWLISLIDQLPKNCFCFDVVYQKDGSKPIFTNLAIKRNLPAIDGLSMLIHQARYAFEFWTGITISKEVMYDALHIPPAYR